MKAKTYADVVQYFDDMLKFAGYAADSLAGLQLQILETTWSVELQATRALELLGEATRRIPPSVKNQFAEIPWVTLMGLRNILAHEYGKIDLATVYRIINEELPPLTVAIREARRVVIGRGDAPLP